jgi:hypothetical protein
VILSQAKNDSTTHWHLDHEQECKDDEDTICAYTASDAACNSTINWLMGQLVEKEEFIDQK